MPFELRLTIYIVAVIFIGGGLLFWILRSPIARMKRRSNPKLFFYGKISTVVNYGDFYLLNDVCFDLPTGERILVDHIIGGEKYVYVILDRYFEGTISGSHNDIYWVYYMESLFGNKKKKEIANPIAQIKSLMEFISLQSIIPQDLLVGIVLVNDDCFISGFENKDANIKLTPVSKLEKLINTYEKQDIDPLEQGKLEALVQKLHDESEKTKNGR